MADGDPNDETLLRRLVRAFGGGVPGIRAIVLGGSQARGEAGPGSDCDIGLYYEPDNPIDVGRLAKAAVLLPGAASSSVTALGEWDPWINGGAWLTVDGKRIDQLHRDLGKVRDVIDACRDGRVGRAYQPGHPHAFVSTIYMGEVAHGYAAGCAFRCIACLCQTLFAVNRTGLLNEKGAVAGVERLAIRPADSSARVRRALGEASAGLAHLSTLVDETAELLKA